MHLALDMDEADSSLVNDLANHVIPLVNMPRPPTAGFVVGHVNGPLINSHDRDSAVHLVCMMNSFTWQTNETSLTYLQMPRLWTDRAPTY